MLPETPLRSPAADWNPDLPVCSQPGAARGDKAHVQQVTSESGLVLPALPICAPIAGLFAGALDTTL
jgi:hypothetical protein